MARTQGEDRDGYAGKLMAGGRFVWLALTAEKQEKTRGRGFGSLDEDEGRERGRRGGNCNAIHS